MIQITLRGNSGSCTRTDLLTSGMVGAQCEFIFDEAWDGLDKTAVFSSGTTQRDVLLGSSICTVPWEALQHSGYSLKVGVFGTNKDGTLVIPTVYVNCGTILEGANLSGTEGGTPTPALLEQIANTASLFADKQFLLDSGMDAGNDAHLKKVQAFTNAMNALSGDIGMTNTLWKSPSGYPSLVAGTPMSYAYNSQTSAVDMLKLLILARHTPVVLDAMSQTRYTYHIGKTEQIATNIVLNSSAYKAWAAEHGYTMIAAKGGSLTGNWGDIGENGILNMTMLLKDADENLYGWAICGLENTAADKDLCRTLAHDLIEMCKGSAESAAITAAAARVHPVGMMCCRLTGSNYEEDLAALDNAICYNKNTQAVAASVSKIMMACVAASQTFINRKIAICASDFVDGNDSYLHAGDTLSFTDALTVCLMRSDNTLATTIARVCGAQIDSPAETFIARYGKSKYADILAAIQAGKCVRMQTSISGSLYELPFVRVMGSNDGRIRFFGGVSSTIYTCAVSPDDTWTTVASTILQDTAARVTAWSSTPSDTRYPSEKLVKSSLDAVYAYIDTMLNNR